jgi:hypothetical protein
MAHKKFGVRPKEWWKHLRWQKRYQEKTTRQHGKTESLRGIPSTAPSRSLRGGQEVHHE